MSTEPEKLTIPVSESDDVTALLYHASKQRKGATLILGHGAGGNQLSPFMRLFASGLASRGLDIMTFNFLYSEKRRGAPDHKAKLEACYLAVINSALANRKLKSNRLVIGGKSMGGRIGSQVAAALETGNLSLEKRSNNISALVFLGYPLHPPGKPEQLRDAHLKQITAPMLFIQGAKDSFGTPGELRAVIRKHRLPATLHLIEGGDHSFKVPKRENVSQEQLYENVMDEIVRWCG
jgi:predicted alpha/beta-hydrolase family hydrolase